MKKIYSLLIIISYYQLANAQISNIIPTSTSIAQTSVSETQSWSAFNNPAMLGNLEITEVGFQFENRYLISELSTKSIQIAHVSNLVNTGLSFAHFGYSLYHEMLIGLGFARNYLDKFSMGVQFNYYTTYFSASNSYRGTLFPQVGLSARLSPNFSLGFNAFNPIQTNLKTEYTIKRIPSIFSFGTEYFFSTDLVWRTQIDKEVSSNYRLATGFEYRMLQSFAIKLGAYGSDYLIPCLGFGCNVGSFLIDLNCELHPLLGLNTMATIRYRFRK
jgi:hypothetical protein